MRLGGTWSGQNHSELTEVSCALCSISWFLPSKARILIHVQLWVSMIPSYPLWTLLCPQCLLLTKCWANEWIFQKKSFILFTLVCTLPLIHTFLYSVFIPLSLWLLTIIRFTDDLINCIIRNQSLSPPNFRTCN